ncbi:uncharacterized protein LOC125944952 [Dermacentor silvarum]|uniref:uncharacterized protein LOC125944952 n=1 Tax=Dermacentor silvarum TaxID=543639 RepID=UPI0021018524|nr:uncharacterized protein LOC125944952 [Dermacentor silvarum]
MSHTVTVTRMTTSSSSPMVINTGYACNIQGALKVVETVSVGHRLRFCAPSQEILFHLVACALYLAASITLLTKTLDYHRNFRGEQYDARVAAAVFGIMNGALYLIGAVLSFRIFRQG